VHHLSVLGSGRGGAGGRVGAYYLLFESMAQVILSERIALSMLRSGGAAQLSQNLYVADYNFAVKQLLATHSKYRSLMFMLLFTECL
jgi:hypothetical protein